MSAFDNLKHLAHWRKTGEFPAIHRDMATAILSSGTVPRFPMADLGCCHGLLGTRVGAVFGVEAKTTYIEEAAAGGVPLKIYNMPISRYTLETLRQLLVEHGIRGVILRRVMSEFFGEDPEGAELFAAMLHAAGVNAIFIQCRKIVVKPRTPFNSIQDEMRPFLNHFMPVYLTPEIAELVRREITVTENRFHMRAGVLMLEAGK